MKTDLNKHGGENYKKMHQVLLKGGHASKVVGEVPDTTMVLMDGVVVKSHRLLLASNSFLHQLIISSWLPGENSTFILPQHSVQDLLLHFSLQLENTCTANGAFDGDTEVGNNGASCDFGKIKVEESDDEEDYISDHHPPPGDMEEFEQANPVLEQTLEEVETPRKRLWPESPSS